MKIYSGTSADGSDAKEFVPAQTADAELSRRQRRAADQLARKHGYADRFAMTKAIKEEQEARYQFETDKAKQYGFNSREEMLQALKEHEAKKKAANS